MPLPRVKRAGKTSWTSVLLVSIVSAALLLGFSGLWRLNARGRAPKRAALGSSQAIMSSLSSTELEAVRSRAKAAVLGAFVADAATMPLHWIYDPVKIQTLVGDAQPEFFPNASSPFYTYELGELSPYGAEALFLLQSIVEHGRVSGPELTADLASMFQHYDGYINSATKKLMANVEAGKMYPDAAANDDQAHSLIKVPIVVARYIGMPHMQEKVVEAVQAHQRGSVASDYAVALTAILERVLLGDTVPQAVAKAQTSAPAQTQAALSKAAHHAHKTQDDVTQAVKTFGASCHLPGSFQGPLVCALHGDSDFATSVRASILSAGDQASRSIVAGALTAAAGGETSIPAAWKRNVTHLSEVEEYLGELLKKRFDEN